MLGELGPAAAHGMPACEADARAEGGHARTINVPTLLGAVLESMDGKGGAGFTPEYLAGLDADQIDRTLREHFRRGLADFKHGERIVPFESGLGPAGGGSDRSLEILIAANTDGVRRMYPQERPLLVLLYDPALQNDLRILQGVVRVLWGDAVEMVSQPSAGGTRPA